jgi:predicted nicotinamide N-methyase
MARARGPDAARPPPLRSWAGVRVVDLGTGTGLVGVTRAIDAGARVVLTDMPHVLPRAVANSDAKGQETAPRGNHSTGYPNT